MKGNRVTVPLPRGGELMSRAAVKSTVEELISFNGIPTEDIVYIQRTKKAISSQSVTERMPLDSKNVVIVEYEDRINDDVHVDNRLNRTQPDILRIPELGISAHPMISHRRVAITVTIRQRSYSELSILLSNMNNLLNTRSSAGYHDLLFNFSVPTSLVAYLGDVFSVLEEDPDFTMEASTFIKESFVDGVLFKSNLAGGSTSLVFNVLETGCLGRFTEFPKEITSGADDTHSELSFEYTLEFKRPTHLNIFYQVFVYNKVIDITPFKPFFIRKSTKLATRGYLTATTTIGALNGTVATEHVNISPFLYEEDHWTPSYIIPKTELIFITPIQTDPDNLKSVVDLNLLVGDAFPVTLLGMILGSGSVLDVPYASPFVLELWEVGLKELPKAINVDPSGIVTSVLDLDFKKRHYLKLSMVTDLTAVNLTYLEEHPAYMLMVLQMLNPKVFTTNSFDILDGLNHPDRLVLMGGTRVNKSSLSTVLKNIRTTSNKYNNQFLQTTRQSDAIISLPFVTRSK